MKHIPSKVEILNWIGEHKELSEDFKAHFGASIEQTLNNDPRKEVYSYNIFDEDKKWSLGEVMTVKEACDLWWNKITIQDECGVDIAHCYKCADGTYELDGLSPNTRIRLDNSATESWEDDQVVYEIGAQLEEE